MPSSRDKELAFRTNVLRRLSSELATAKAKFPPYECTILDAVRIREAEKEVGESEETRTIALRMLKKRLNGVVDLEAFQEDNFLLRFLRACKFDHQKSYDRVMKYYHSLERMAEIFKGCYLTQEMIDQNLYLWMSPLRMENYAAVFVGRGGAVDYGMMSFEQRFCLDMIVFNDMLSSPVNQLCGFHMILDYAGFSFRSFRAHTPRMVHLLVDTLQNVLPARLKSIHMLNLPSLASTAFKLAQPLLSKKVKSRLHIHPRSDNFKGLQTIIPPDVLPEEYGGFVKDSHMINLLTNIKEKERNYYEQLQFGFHKSKYRRKSLNMLAF